LQEASEQFQSLNTYFIFFPIVQLFQLLNIKTLLRHSGQFKKSSKLYRKYPSGFSGKAKVEYEN